MSSNFLLNNKEINAKIVKNVLIMLKRRQKISDIESIYNSLQEDINTTTVFKFTSDNNKFGINILNSKLNSIISKSPLDEYLNSNLDVRKIIIIYKPSKRAVKQLFSSYQNCEFFFLREMIEDICSKVFVPEHVILNNDDKNDLLKRFKLKDLSKILNTDVMSRYYNAKIDDIFKIIRPNITTGNSIFYRAVVNGKIDNLFP